MTRPRSLNISFESTWDVVRTGIAGGSFKFEASVTMVPFGFSVGDFVSAIALAQKIGKALSESRGSSYEINAAVQLLSSVAAAVEESRLIFVAAESLNGIHSPSILNGIVTESQKCRQIMDTFMTRSKSYTNALVNGQGSRAKREWKKVTWCLFHEKDIHNMENNLQCHLTALCMYNVAHLRFVSPILSKAALTK